MKPSALVLSPEPPFPAIGGGALRSASALTWLAARYHLDLVLFAVDGARDPASGIPPGLVSNIFQIPLPAHSKSPPHRIARNLIRLIKGVPPLLDRFSGRDSQLAAFLHGRHYDLGWIEHFWCAPYVHLLARHCSRLALDLHNIESVWHARTAAAEPFPASLGHRLFAACCRSREAALLPRFHTVLVPSQSDAALVAAHSPQTIVYPNAIPSVPLPRLPKRHEIIFSGNLEYHPNQQAVHYFHRRIWPILRSKHPGLLWRILGKNPHALHPSLHRDNSVILTGPVPDAIPELASSKIAVVPVLAGSGTRVKILEAWAAGVPVVSTTIGAEGLDAVPGRHLLLADNPVDFVASVSGILASDERLSRLAAEGRCLYEQRYTWEVAWRQLDREIILSP